MNKAWNLIAIFSLLMLLLSCQEKEKQLPILGPKEVQASSGTGIPDTVYHTIPDFTFTNQDSQQVTPATFKGKIYVADFFFTSCPSICPIMKSQMLRVYEKYKDNDKVKFLSHSIDPTHDTVAVLKDYAERLGVSSDHWHFITGDKEAIYDIAQNSYMVSAMEDQSQPGGIVHSGAFILVDPQRRIRGYYDGTSEGSVDQLMEDIELSLNGEKAMEVNQ